MNRARLTVAFLRAHPREAARALEQLNASDVSALLAAMPGRVAAPVIGRLPPGFAARSLASLRTRRWCGCWRRLSTRRSQRCCATCRRSDARACSTSCLQPRRRSRMLLRYPRTVSRRWPNRGADARPGMRCARCWRGSRPRATTSAIFSTSLTRSGGCAPRCARPAAACLAVDVGGRRRGGGRAGAAGAGRTAHGARPRRLDAVLDLPVVERNGRLVGALRQGVLIHAVERGPRVRVRRDASSLRRSPRAAGRDGGAAAVAGQRAAGRAAPG